MLQKSPAAADIRPVPQSSYQQRPIRFIEFWQPVADWGLKVYGVNHDLDRNTSSTIVDESLLTAAKEVVVSTLHKPEFSSDVVHKAGFMIVHQGLLGNWLLFDWWSHDVLWNQRLFRSESPTQPAFAPVTNGIIACVWEVSVLAFERDAWSRHILQSDRNGDRQAALQAYFDSRFNGDV